MLRIEVLTVGSREHRLALELRHRILRQPLGLGELSPGELELEPQAVHWGCFFGSGDEELVGTLLLKPRGPHEVQMRQVAVAAARQRQGIGRLLVQHAETWCREGIVDNVSCCLFAHAREQAVPFYAKLGYRVVGEPFEEVGLVHRRVEKQLSSATE